MDPSDLFESDIMSQIPTNFYTQIESKKWSERKEALEVIEKITSVSLIQDGDFNDLVRVLKKTIAKDANIVVVTLAAKCLCQLAKGLRYKFAPHASYSLPVIFDKFKEKKPNVINVLRDAADAVFIGTNLESVHDDIILFLDNKNPQIKSEMALFLSRVYANHPAQVKNKKTLRPLINALIKTLSDMDATVRENSAMAIGTAMKVIGEKLMMTLIADVEPLKIQKIKEFCEKAEIVSPPTNGQNHAPVPELTNGQPIELIAQTNGVAQEDEDDEDKLYDMLEAVDVYSQIPVSFFSQMESKKWSERKEALEIIEKITSVPKIQDGDFNELVRILKKTIAKDANIVVVTLAAKCLCQLAKGLRYKFAPHASYSLPVIFDKFKEKKPNVIIVLRDAADAAFIGTNLEDVHEDVILFLDNKNPQIKSELALFLSRVFANYPAQVMNKKTLRPLINALIKTLSDMDATVRENSAMAIGTAMKVTGEKLMMTLIADVEPIKIPKIKEFCEKAEVKKLPKSAINAMNPTTNMPPPQFNKQCPPVKSSATMVRSTSSKRAPTARQSGVMAPKVSAAPAASNATVKRTATIIKRSTVPKRNSGTSQPPVVSSMPAPAPPAAPVITIPQIPAPTFVPSMPGSLQQPSFTSTPAKPVFSTTTHEPTTNTKDDNIDAVIFRLISDSDEEVLDSLAILEELLSMDSDQVLRYRINQIIDLTSLQLIKCFDNQKTRSKENSQTQMIVRVCDCISKIFTRRQLVSAANHQSIRFLLVQLFTLTQSCSNINGEYDETVLTLNKLALAIMDGFEPANIMCILTGLLNDPPPASIVEPIKTAIIRSMRSFK